jgi:hypothetical protein
MFDRLMQPLAQQRQAGGSSVRYSADADGSGVQLEQLHLLGVGRRAQDEADRRFSPGARSCLSSQRR